MAVSTPSPAVTSRTFRADTPVSRRDRWLVLVGTWLLRVLASTLSIEVEDPAALRARIDSESFILLFWHNRLLLVAIIWNCFFAAHRRKGMALTSTSRDGGLIAAFLAQFGIGPVRGSTAQRGSLALREMAGWLRRGHDVAITPDGSRGPCYTMKAGPILLAQLTGRPLLPISFEFSRAWRLRNWDRFFIPKPFSRVTFRVGALHTVDRTASDADFESARRRGEDLLMAITRER